MSFKNLSINFDIIPIKLDEYADDGSVKHSFKGAAHHFSFRKDGNEALIIVYKKNDGRVTIQASGKNLELSSSAALYIKKQLRSIDYQKFLYIFALFPR